MQWSTALFIAAVCATSACQKSGFLGFGREKGKRSEGVRVSPKETDNSGSRAGDRGGISDRPETLEPASPGGENVSAGQQPIPGSERFLPYGPPGTNGPGLPGQPGGVGPYPPYPGSGSGSSGGGVFLPPWFVGSASGPYIPELPPFVGDPSEGFPPWSGGGSGAGGTGGSGGGSGNGGFVPGGSNSGNPNEGFPGQFVSPRPSEPPSEPPCEPGKDCDGGSGGSSTGSGTTTGSGGSGTAVCDARQRPCPSPSSTPGRDSPNESFPKVDHPIFGGGTGVIKCVPGRPCKPPVMPPREAFGSSTWTYWGGDLVLPPMGWQDPPQFYPPLPPVVHYPPYPPPEGKVWLELTVIQTDHESWWKNCLWAAVEGNQDWTPIACNKDRSANGRKVFLLADAYPACNKVQVLIETYHNQGNICNLRMQQGLPCEGPYAEQGRVDYSRNPFFAHEAVFYRMYDRQTIRNPDPLIRPNVNWVIGDVNALSAAMTEYRADGRNKWLRVFFEDQPRENLDRTIAAPQQWQRLGVDFNDYVFDVKGLNVKFDIAGSGLSCESR